MRTLTLGAWGWYVGLIFGAGVIIVSAPRNNEFAASHVVPHGKSSYVTRFEYIFVTNEAKHPENPISLKKFLVSQPGTFPMPPLFKREPLCGNRAHWQCTPAKLSRVDLIGENTVWGAGSEDIQPLQDGRCFPVVFEQKLRFLACEHHFLHAEMATRFPQDVLVNFYARLFDSDKDISSLKKGDEFGSYLSRLRGVASGTPHFESGNPQTSGYQNEGGSGHRSHGDPNQRPPIVRRLILMFCGFGTGLLWWLRGWHNFYEGRRRLCAAQVGLSLLLMIGGLGIWVLIGFKWSWGWWL